MKGARVLVRVCVVGASPPAVLCSCLCTGMRGILLARGRLIVACLLDLFVGWLAGCLLVGLLSWVCLNNDQRRPPGIRGSVSPRRGWFTKLRWRLLSFTIAFRALLHPLVMRRRNIAPTLLAAVALKQKGKGSRGVLSADNNAHKYVYINIYICCC